jgi:uncharacterized membrane protein YphA (DoxX/SURF4 family)
LKHPHSTQDPDLGEGCLPYHIQDKAGGDLMGIAYLVVTIVLAAIVLFSGIGKLRNDPHIVKVIHETVGVPMKYFPALAACELAGATGLVLGIWLPFLGIAASIGLVIYFVGAVVSHLRVGDAKGIGPAAMLLTMSAAALCLRILSHKAVP